MKSLKKDLFCKRFGIDAGGRNEKYICVSKSMGVFLYPLSKRRKTGELGNHEENVIKSSVDRRDFCSSSSLSVSPNISNSEKPEHS